MLKQTNLSVSSTKNANQRIWIIRSEKRRQFIPPLERYNEKLRVQKCSVSRRRGFDAGLCKIRRIALPIDNDDVANKWFMQQSMQILKDR